MPLQPRGRPSLIFTHPNALFCSLSNLTHANKLAEVDASQQQELLKLKVRQCCIVFDFTNPISDAEGKELKREILKELVDYISNEENQHEPFASDIYAEVFNMVRNFYLLFVLKMKLISLHKRYKSISFGRWPHESTQQGRRTIRRRTSRSWRKRGRT